MRSCGSAGPATTKRKSNCGLARHCGLAGAPVLSSRAAIRRRRDSCGSRQCARRSPHAGLERFDPPVEYSEPTVVPNGRSAPVLPHAILTTHGTAVPALACARRDLTRTASDDDAFSFATRHSGRTAGSRSKSAVTTNTRRLTSGSGFARQGERRAARARHRCLLRLPERCGCKGNHRTDVPQGLQTDTRAEGRAGCMAATRIPCRAVVAACGQTSGQSARSAACR
ncbi:hypothetical protein B0G77_6438 [Paraburkholderia sp. BL10I2N1]|nr:hypothetical protein B0G77_6438 [Paraburkholderia sp. BL10I2N1]